MKTPKTSTPITAAPEAVRKRPPRERKVNAFPAALNSDLSAEYLGMSLRYFQGTERKKPGFPLPIDPSGNGLMVRWRRADLDRWLESQPTVTVTEPTQLAVGKAAKREKGEHGGGRGGGSRTPQIAKTRASPRKSVEEVSIEPSRSGAA